MGAAIALSLRTIKTLVAAVAITTAVAFPVLGGNIHERGASANEATYYHTLIEPAIPNEVKTYIAHILNKPSNFSERVLASALKKIGNPDYEEENGNSNIAPGITKMLKEVGAKAGSSWCAASITDDLHTALGHKPPIGSASVSQLFNQAYYHLVLYRGVRGLQAGDIISHTDTSHAFLFLMFDPQNPKFFWGIDGNGQDWEGSTPHEGERLVYRPISKIKEYIRVRDLENMAAFAIWED